MLTKDQHTIGSQQIELTLGNEQTAFKTQQRFGNAVKDVIAQKITTILTEAVGEKEYLRISRMTLDLGDIFEEDIEKRVADSLPTLFSQELQQSLTKTVPSKSFSPYNSNYREESHQSQSIETMSIGDLSYSIFLYYLVNGTFPQWAPKVSFQQLEQHLDKELPHINKSQLAELTKLLRSSNQVVKRLVHQCSFSLCDQVMSLVLPSKLCLQIKKIVNLISKNLYIKSAADLDSQLLIQHCYTVAYVFSLHSEQSVKKDEMLRHIISTLGLNDQKIVSVLSKRVSAHHRTILEESIQLIQQITEQKDVKSILGNFIQSLIVYSIQSDNQPLSSQTIITGLLESTTPKIVDGPKEVAVQNLYKKALGNAQYSLCNELCATYPYLSPLHIDNLSDIQRDGKSKEIKKSLTSSDEELERVRTIENIPVRDSINNIKDLDKKSRECDQELQNTDNTEVITRNTSISGGVADETYTKDITQDSDQFCQKSGSEKDKRSDNQEEMKTSFKHNEIEKVSKQSTLNKEGLVNTQQSENDYKHIIEQEKETPERVRYKQESEHPLQNTKMQTPHKVSKESSDKELAHTAQKNKLDNTLEKVSLESITNDKIGELKDRNDSQKGNSKYINVEKKHIQNKEVKKTHSPTDENESGEEVNPKEIEPVKLIHSTGIDEPQTIHTRKTDNQLIIKFRNELNSSSHFVENAGIVIVTPFLSTIFKELSLIENSKFVNIHAQCKAVHLLHYVATQALNEHEHVMTLYKILCAIPFEETVSKDICLSQTEKDEAEKLLATIVKHWSALKGSSPEALRTGFFQRDGKLSRVDNGWKLVVERKTVDILLSKIPWGFSVIKLPWMKEFVYVEW